MTTIVLPLLTALAAAILAVLLTGLIKLNQWKKQSAAQHQNLENIEKYLTAVERALQAGIKQAAETAAFDKKRLDEIVMLKAGSESKETEPLAAIRPAEPSVPTNPVVKPQPVQPEENERIKETKRKPDNTGPGAADSAGNRAVEIENLDKGSELPATSIYNIGKSGKIYTEEELELLIKE